MYSFTNSRSHSIVGCGIVEKHPLYLLHKYFLPSVVGKVKYSQRKAAARLLGFVTVSGEAFALLCIANTYDKVVFKYFKEQPDVLNWDHGNMPSPPNVIKSKYTDKRADKTSPKLQGRSIEGLTVFDRWCHDIATSRLTKNSDDLENAILRHKKICLEEQRIRSGSAYSLSKQCRDQEKRNVESGSYCNYRISE
jgi:ribosomal protein S21